MILKLKRLNFFNPQSVFYISIIVLSLIYLAPYIFLASEKASLLTNQLRILISFIGATIIFLIQKKLFSFYFLTGLVLIYFLQGLYFITIGLDQFFFRSLSLSYIFISFFTLVVFQYKEYINKEKFKNYLTVLILVFYIWIIYSFFLGNDKSLIIRPHGLIIFSATIMTAGLKLGKFNVLLLFLGTLILSYFSYNSRIAIIVMIVLILGEYRLKDYILYFLPLFFFLPVDFFYRFNESGIEDFGRAYIYDCFFNNFSKLNYFMPTYTGLERCYEFEYLHSSYLILFIEYGSVFGVLLIISSLFLFLKTLLMKQENYPTLSTFISVFLFSSVEGGMEWFYLFSIGLLFLKMKSQYFK
jgi:hypothetical protein